MRDRSDWSRAEASLHSPKLEVKIKVEVKVEVKIEVGLS